MSLIIQSELPWLIPWNQTLDVHRGSALVGVPLNRFKPSSKYFTDRSKVVLLLWIFYVFFSVLCLLCQCMRLFIFALCSPAGKGLTSWHSFVVSNCEFVAFPLISWVRCCT